MKSNIASKISTTEKRKERQRINNRKNNQNKA